MSTHKSTGPRADHFGGGPRAAPVRSGIATSESPTGILFGVLVRFQEHSGIPTDGVVGARTLGAMDGFQRFFAAPGIGCDAVTLKTVRRTPSPVGSVRSTPVTVESRCGADPCAWFSYYHRLSPGCSLGVRACRDHVDIARLEDSWVRSKAKSAEFLAWEVMST